MQDDTQFSPEESEGRNRQLFSDLRRIYHTEAEKETAQHVNLVREHLLQKRTVPTDRQNGIFKHPVVLDMQQERADNMNSSYVRPHASSGRNKNHYLSTIAATILVSVLVGSFVLVLGHFHLSKSEGPVPTPTPTHATWSFTGNMNIARDAHTATLLRNGKVLVVGGVHLMTATHRYDSTAEIYDPATGKWSLTGSLHIARSSQTAILLANGRVLVAGGETESGITASAEVYDPSTGTWSLTGSMHAARVNHTATLLPGGNVLVTGGYGNQEGAGPYTSAELYDPATGKWSFTASMHYPRSGHTATLLTTGKVLVAGGTYAEAELYDLSHSTWSLTGSMQVVRAGQTATLLLNGKVLVAGGNNDRGLFASAELYDPTIGKWSLTGSMHDARIAHTATLLPDGNVLVVGGERDFFGFQQVTSTEVYDAVKGMWSLTASMAMPRDGQTATLLPNGEVLVAGGFNYPNELKSAELYTPAHS